MSEVFSALADPTRRAILARLAEGEATVKRFHREGGRVQLVPENPAYEPIELTDGRILGRVVAVLRKL